MKILDKPYKNHCKLFLVAGLCLSISLDVAAQTNHSYSLKGSGSVDISVHYSGIVVWIPIDNQEPQEKSQTFPLEDVDLSNSIVDQKLNGDGYADFSVGWRKDGYHYDRIFIYLPEQKKFVEAGKTPEFIRRTGTTRFVNARYDPKEYVVRTRPPNIERWRYAWKIDLNGNPWVYKQLKALQEIEIPLIVKELITHREITYNKQGDITDTHLSTASGKKAVGTVYGSRLYLYDRPETGAKTRMYLIKGDTYILLDIKGKNWLKIRYQNPRKGAIDKWISVPEAYRQAVKASGNHPPSNSSKNR